MQQQHSVIRAIEALIQAPSNPDEYSVWAQQTQTLDFLRENAEHDSVVLTLSVGQIFAHSVFVPIGLVSPPNWEDLLKWDANAYSSWSMMTSGDWVGLAGPLHHSGSKTIESGEQFVFARNFEGVPQRASYIEILQRLIHIFGLHYLEERDAWCRLNKHGDLEDVFRVVKIKEPNSDHEGRLVIGDRAVLAQYANLTNAHLVRMFDLTCIPPGRSPHWGDTDEKTLTHGLEISYRFGVVGGGSTYTRGAQIIPYQLSSEEMRRTIWGENETKKYATFIAFDRKNQCIAEISCAPGATDNYFIKSDKPWEVSPAFFRPEVLLKCKADYEKYDLQHRSIGCRGAWSLKTFDINAEGQVHTYLVYLRTLPYEEQLHWLQHNEEPKGPISARAHRTDILGEWDEDYDPLLTLKHQLERLAQAKVDWWTPRSMDVARRAHYPVTTSPDEWANELLNLDQYLVEGFQEKALRARAARSGPTPSVQTRSLGLLEACLVGSGFEPDHAKEIVAPLRDLHSLRNTTKGHAVGEGAAKVRRDLIKTYGSLREHYIDLVTRCDEAMQAVTEGLKTST
jgi:hypothetical protein